MSGELFAISPKVRLGYDRAQVDEFFTTARAAYEGRSNQVVSPANIQSVSFDLVRSGYDTAEVDAALDRLEAAFVGRARVAYLQHYGAPSWQGLLAERARTLYPRLSRRRGQRFAPPLRGEQGYSATEVDDLCDRLIAFFDQNVPLASAEIRAATFTRAKGRAAYAEGPVDAFLARAVEVLLGVE